MARPTPQEDDGEKTILGMPSLPPLVEPGTAEADTIIVTRAVPAPRAGAAGSPAIESPAVEAVPEVEVGPERFALRIGTHAPIPLDVPAYIGRRPSTPRITGTKMPRLVMVPSPSREVSSTHVEFRQEGSTVVVTDLGSTNGTTVSNPGFAPLGLRQGESVVVAAGSVVDIGDGIRIVVVSDPTSLTGEGEA